MRTQQHTSLEQNAENAAMTVLYITKDTSKLLSNLLKQSSWTG